MSCIFPGFRGNVHADRGVIGVAHVSLGMQIELGCLGAETLCGRHILYCC
jgi:hypothetical protein